MKRTHAVIIFFIAFLCWTALSCASAGQVTSPAPIHERTMSEAGRLLQGVFDVTIDLQNETVSVSLNRAVEAHYDVTQFLFPPHCPDCFSIRIIELDWDNRTVTADVTVRNFTAALTGYDVRGIVYTSSDFILENPYAYTLLHAPSGITDPVGFRAFDTADPERAMAPVELATETFIIGFPPDVNFMRLTYAIDASWPEHCQEPYEITAFQQEPLDIIPGSDATISVTVQDWQEDVAQVTINTDILGGTQVNLDQTTDETWSGTIENVLGVGIGDYPVMIAARSESSVIYLYQQVEIEISDLSDLDPPVWDDEVGIIEAKPGLSAVLVEFGTASDPCEPVTYNLYWSDTEPIDFQTAPVVRGIEESPYLLEIPIPGAYVLCVRAEDNCGNETDNNDATSAAIGEHPNVWWTLGPDMPTARGYAGGCLADGYFWVLGGSAGAIWYDTVERYSIANGTWDSPWSLPETRDGFGCVGLDGMAWIFGGRFAETDVTDSCHVINLDDGSCVMSPPTLPAALATVGCAPLDGTIFIAGGRHYTGSTWEFHREAYRLTPPSNEFEGATDLEFETSTMGFASSVKDGNGVLISCGGHPDRTDVLIHVPGTKSWQSIAPINPGREGNVAVESNGWFYSIGGNTIDIAIVNVDVLDVQNDTWYSINPLNEGRGAAVAATDGEFIYVAGGLKLVGPTFVPVSSLEIGKIY